MSNFLQDMETKAEAFFNKMEDAAPSSTEPVPNAPAVDVAANSDPESLPSAPDAASTGDETDSGQASPSESAAGPTGTEDPNVAPVAEQTSQPTATGMVIAEAAITAAPVSEAETDSPNGASSVVFSVDENTPASVKDALSSVSESPIAASSPAEPKSFVQRVEERFQFLEAALLKLPHSIAAVMHRGSLAPEEFAAAVHAHLFGQDK